MQIRVLESAKADSFTITIEDGCTVCNTCETSCPLIFDVKEDGVKFRKDYERYLYTEIDNIILAVDGCPHNIIKIIRKINQPNKVMHRRAGLGIF